MDMADQVAGVLSTSAELHNCVGITSDESKTKTFSPVAVSHLIAAFNRGVSGRQAHMDERKLIAQTLNVNIERITVDFIIDN